MPPHATSVLNTGITIAKKHAHRLAISPVFEVCLMLFHEFSELLVFNFHYKNLLDYGNIIIKLLFLLTCSIFSSKCCKILLHETPLCISQLE